MHPIELTPGDILAIMVFVGGLCWFVSWLFDDEVIGGNGEDER